MPGFIGGGGGGGGGGGVTDHGALTGRGDDDHGQYHTDARGDARYSALAHGHAPAVEGGASGFLTGAQAAKLAGVQAGATANSDASIDGRADARIAAARGAAGGLASLDGAGLVPASQLPGYVDDVLEYANLAAFPGAGEAGKLYVAIDTGSVYRWSGSAYVSLSAAPQYATQAEAEAGAENTKTMTALRTAQAIAARAREALLTGLSTASAAAVAATDSILQAVGKLQAQLGLKVNAVTAGATVSAARNLAAADIDRETVVDTSAGAVALTLVAGAFSAVGQVMLFRRSGANALSFVQGAGTTLTNPYGYVAGAGEVIGLRATGADAAEVIGSEAPFATQAEAEAGTEAAARRFSPLRVAQAIAALAGEASLPATASQAEAEAGTLAELRSFTPQRIAQAIAALAPGGANFPVTVSGATPIGSMLTATAGSGWDITPGNWTRDGVDIVDATALTYVTVTADAETEVTYVPDLLPYVAAGVLVDAAAGGGGGLQLEDSDGNVASEAVTVSALLAPAGANRYLAAAILITDFNGGLEDGMTLNGDALGQVGVENTYGSGFVLRTSHFELVAPDVPVDPEVTVDLVANATTGPPFTLAEVGAVYSGVNQVTPRGAVYTNAGSFTGPAASGAASVEVSDALEGDTILAFLYIRDAASGTPVLSDFSNAGAVLPGEVAAGPHRLSAVQFIAAADAPTVGMTITTGVPDEVQWELRAFKVNPA